MATNKTIENNNSVTAYINTIADEKKRKDVAELLSLFSQQTGFPAKMWGSAIVGFGSYHYKYESGREGDAPLTGLSARKNAIVLYFSADFEKRDEWLLKLGKHKSGKGCVYIQKLADIDTGILKQIITTSVNYIRQQYPG